MASSIAIPDVPYVSEISPAVASVFKDGALEEGDAAAAIEWLTVSAQNDPDPARRDQAREMIKNLEILIKAAS